MLVKITHVVCRCLMRFLPLKCLMLLKSWKGLACFSENQTGDTDRLLVFTEDGPEWSEGIVNQLYWFISLSVRDTVLELKAYCFILYLAASPGVILTILIEYRSYCSQLLLSPQSDCYMVFSRKLCGWRCGSCALPSARNSSCSRFGK